MSDYFSCEIYRGRPMVRFTGNPIVATKSFAIMYEAVLQVTDDMEVTILNNKDQCITISVHRYYQIAIEEGKCVPEQFYTSGIFVNTEKQADELAYEFEKIRTWNLLKN